jgi:hypothetical protein
MNQTDAKLRSLLQLKKLETPGPAYFDAFLDEFHRYQRAEILRQPTWQERLATALAFLNPFSRLTPAASWSLAGSMACLSLLIGIAAFQSPATSTGSALAQQGWNESGYVTAPATAVPVGLPEEITLTASSFDQDFASPRYVTGQALVAYDSSLAF